MTHRFRIGECVNLIATGSGPERGIHRVTALMPERNGEPEYRIRSEASGSSKERLALETELGRIVPYSAR